jgi:hypothetical protein
MYWISKHHNYFRSMNILGVGCCDRAAWVNSSNTGTGGSNTIQGMGVCLLSPYCVFFHVQGIKVKLSLCLTN